MDKELVARIEADPRYRELISRRGRLANTLTAIVLVAYFGYIGLIAFDKAILGTPVGDGVMSVGIPVGLGLIGLTILLTAVYVVRANRDFDPLTKAIVEELQR